MVTVKKLYDLDPNVEWLPFLNEVFNPAVRIHRHTQVISISYDLSEIDFNRWQFLQRTLSKRWEHLSKKWR